MAPTFVNHSAPPGLPPDGAGVKQLAAAFRTAFPDGQVVEHWQAVDSFGRLQRLGAIPPPGQARP